MRDVAVVFWRGMKVSQEILDLIPYKPGKPIEEAQREYGVEKVCKLASNENPLGVSSRVKEALIRAMEKTHLYPDPSCYELTQKVSEHYGVDANWLCFGNGSNELIDLLIRIYCEPGQSILTSQASFIAYRICAQAARVKTIEVPLRPDLSIDIPALVETYTKMEVKPALIFLPNPNNPTGTCAGQEEVDLLVNAVGGREETLLVFDEAYNEFVRREDYPDTLNYLRRFANIVVLRTMSKVYGLAALRVGSLIAKPHITNLVHRVRNPFNVNHLAQVAAVAAFEDEDYLRRSQELVWSGLDYFYEKLRDLGLPYVESQANFVLFDTLQEASSVSEALFRRGVLLRPVGAYGFPQHLRMSVGLPEDNEMAMAELEDVLKGMQK